MSKVEKTQTKAMNSQHDTSGQMSNLGRTDFAHKTQLSPPSTRRAIASAQVSYPSNILHLQRSVGNRVIQRLLSSKERPPISANQDNLPAHSISSPTVSSSTVPSIQRHIDRTVYDDFVATGDRQNGKNATRKWLFFKPTYLKVRNGLDEYTQRQDGMDKNAKVKKLMTIEAGIRSWLNSSSHQKDTSADGVRRRNALLALQPIVRKELALVDPIYRDKNKIKDSGVIGTGATKSVTQLEFDRDIGDSGSNVGVFSVPPSTLPPSITKAASSGIDLNNPNLGNRTLAVVAVAHLFGSTVMAESKRATIRKQQGILMEKAKGVSPVRVEWQELTDPDMVSVAEETLAEPDSVMYDEFQYDKKKNKYYKRQQKANRIHFNHPEIQRQLIEMQILDAITGQVDRHAGNYFVDQSGGRNVVKGIDLDLSFGKDKRVAKLDHQDSSMRDLPPIVQASFATRVIGVGEHRVRAALDGLLSPEEIDATILRYQSVCSYLESIQATGWVEDFNEETSSLLTENNSYLGRDRSRQQELEGRGFVIG